MWHSVWDGLQVTQDQEVANYSESMRLSPSQVDTDRPDGCGDRDGEHRESCAGGLSVNLFIQETVYLSRKCPIAEHYLKLWVGNVEQSTELIKRTLPCHTHLTLQDGGLGPIIERPY